MACASIAASTTKRTSGTTDLQFRSPSIRRSCNKSLHKSTVIRSLMLVRMSGFSRHMSERLSRQSGAGVPQKKIVALEPDTTHFDCLRRTLSEQEGDLSVKATVCQMAISDSVEDSPLYKGMGRVSTPTPS